MKIALFTVDGQAMCLAYHLQSEGHEVYVGQVGDWKQVNVKITEEPDERRKRLCQYQGLFQNKWSADKLLSFLLGQPRGQRDLWFVLCDFNWLWPYADKLLRAGYRGLLPSREDYELEVDRKRAHDLIKKSYPDVEVGQYVEFKTIPEAEKFLEENDDTLFVLKGLHPDAPTVVPKTDDIQINRELILDALEREKNYEKEGFVLEEKIEDGLEITPEAIGYDGQVVGVNVTLENKLFGSRDGAITECSQVLMCWQDDNQSLYDRFLKPLEDRMLRPNQLTFWDLSVLYSPSRDKFYAGEFCPNRMGYDTIQAEIATFNSITEWMEFGLCADVTWIGGGEDYGRRFDYGATVRVSNVKEDKALVIADPADAHLWFYDLFMEKGKLYSTGVDMHFGVVSGRGTSEDAAIQAIYANKERLVFNPGYSLQLHDWYDTEFPQNILRRLQVLRDIGVLKGGDKNGENEKDRERVELNRDSGSS